MTPIVLEVCVTTAEEAQRAVVAGADRLELCGALEVGGITPSPGVFLDVREAVTVPICVLVRPRSGGFVYTVSEFHTILRDAAWFLAHGASAIVSGFLKLDRTINRERCAQFVALAPKSAIFHRAFEFVEDPLSSLETLIDLGFKRILTSGGATSALDGIANLATWMTVAQDRIEILPAGGIRPENVAAIIAGSGCKQVHGSFREAILSDDLGSSAIAVQMGYRSETNGELVTAMRKVIDRIGLQEASETKS